MRTIGAANYCENCNQLLATNKEGLQSSYQSIKSPPYDAQASDALPDEVMKLPQKSCGV